MLHINRCVLMRQTQWSHSQRSISVQSRVIDKQLFVASNDLWWPFKRLLAKKRTLTIAAVPNHPDFERFGLFLRVHMDLEAFSFFSIDLQWRGHGADLTLGHRYKKSEIYKLEVLMPSCNPPSLKPLWQTLQAGHDCKLFLGKVS